MNKNEAAAKIGISVRSLQRDTQNKLIDGAYRDVGGKMVLDYSDKEVERWTKERRRVVPESITLATRNTELVDGRAENFLAKIEEAIINGFVEGRNYMLPAGNAKNGAKVDLKDKLILSLPEAVKLSGIPRERLRTALLPDGTALFFKEDRRIGRGYRVRKMDLIEYIHSLDLPPGEMEQHKK